MARSNGWWEIAALVTVLAIAACNNGPGACEDSCTQYNACVEPIGITDCTEMCEEEAADEENFEESVERCAECVDDRLCSEIEVCWETICPEFGDL